MLWFPQALKPFFLNEFKLTPVVELRGRFERRTDRDLSDAAGDNRSAFETRARIGVDFTDGKNVSGKFRYQYAHALRWSNPLNDSDMNSDVYLAYADFKSDAGTVGVGRQTLNYGDKIILEESNTGQRSKSYDLIRFRNKTVDAWAGKVGYHNNRSDQARLIGGSVKWNLGESLVFFKSDRWVTNANYWTLDHRYAGKADKLTYVAEGALQRGTINGKELDAWLLHGRVNFSVNPNTTVFLEGTAVSGGGDANKTRGFDATYGTSHVLLGLMDIQGYRNVNAIEIGANYKPNAKSEYLFSIGNYSLRDSRDGWYGTGGGINRGPGGPFIDPSGAAGRNVGTEFNLMGRWVTGKDQSFQAELGLFKPGSFIKSFNGASTKDSLWALFTYNIKF